MMLWMEVEEQSCGKCSRDIPGLESGEAYKRELEALALGGVGKVALNNQQTFCCT